MNKLIATACILSPLLIALVLTHPYGENAAIFVGLLTAVQWLGAAIIVAGDRRVGAWLVMAGSVPMVPAGLFGVFGARRVLDQLSEEEFEHGA